MRSGRPPGIPRGTVGAGSRHTSSAGRGHDRHRHDGRHPTRPAGRQSSVRVSCTPPTRAEQML
jgi:hypothetical protein